MNESINHESTIIQSINPSINTGPNGSPIESLQASIPAGLEASWLAGLEAGWPEC